MFARFMKYIVTYAFLKNWFKKKKIAQALYF